jgi:hypothetical protein
MNQTDQPVQIQNTKSELILNRNCFDVLKIFINSVCAHHFMRTIWKICFPVGVCFNYYFWISFSKCVFFFLENVFIPIFLFSSIAMLFPVKLTKWRIYTKKNIVVNLWKIIQLFQNKKENSTQMETIFSGFNCTICSHKKGAN